MHCEVRTRLPRASGQAHVRMCDCVHYARLSYGTRDVRAPHAQKSACRHRQSGPQDRDLARQEATCGMAARQHAALENRSNSMGSLGFTS